ncbi:MAG: endonuclease [Nocardioides sp.]|uniref:endonuclease n=1 Tax=Nocardioides sp. TaxID=35761 RepID=UPI0039E45630
MSRSNQTRQADVVASLLARHGTTYAEAAGIRLADKPAPLWQLLVLSLLLSARIGADVAVAGARELFSAGYRTPRRMHEASWQDRVDALGRGHYRRYDERTATQLGEVASRVLDDYRGDLRRLPHHDAGEAERALRRFTGIGPVGAAIFCREAQAVWPALAPYVDDLVAEGAHRLGLPRTPRRLAALVSGDDLPRLAAACVRVARGEVHPDDV